MGENAKYPGYRKRFTLEQREHIRKLWEEGWTVSEIAAEMGKPVNTLYYSLSRGFVKEELLPNGRYKYDPKKGKQNFFGAPPINPKKKDKE